MNPEIEFSILVLYQLEHLTTEEIFIYFQCEIPIEYITNLLINADNNEEYFDKILLNYLIC